jgi:hypothetical protein
MRLPGCSPALAADGSRPKGDAGKPEQEPAVPPFVADCRPILIGSLPLTDHRQAVALILRHCPEIPVWPQLPRLPREGMLRQFLDGFPGLSESGDRFWVASDREDFPSLMAAFYQDCFEVDASPALLATSRFALAPTAAPGFFTLREALAGNSPLPYSVKGQLTGPITAGIGLKDHRAKAVLYDDSLRDILVKLLARRGQWQAEQLRPLAGEAPPLVFIDEPGMVAFGAGGFSGVSAEMVTGAVGEVVAAIQAAGGLAGIHICANGDWGPALSAAADLISFDAYSYFKNFILYREPLCRFLARGGMLAWGIIPTGDRQALAAASPADLFALWRRQVDTLASFGIDRRQLLRQTLIAPACGTGSLTPELAARVLQLTTTVSQLARHELARVAS